MNPPPVPSLPARSPCNGPAWYVPLTAEEALLVGQLTNRAARIIGRRMAAELRRQLARVRPADLAGDKRLPVEAAEEP